MRPRWKRGRGQRSFIVRLREDAGIEASAFARRRHAVHEAENYFGRPLEPGHGLRARSEIFIPEESLYFRCEDHRCVTETGCEKPHQRRAA